MTDRHTADLETCMDCGRTLAPHEDWICGPCMERRADDYYDPSDEDILRRDANIRRGYRELATLIFGALVLLLVAGAWAHEAHATSPTLSRTVDGRTLTWPAIGTEAYSRSCRVYKAYDDGTAYAYCTEDGGSFVFNPGPDTWYSVGTAR